MASDPDTIARSFVEYYYTAFDSGKEGIKSLASLYKDVSMLTYEQNKFQGTDQIIGGLVDMPFQKVVHTIFSVDAQPSGVDGALLVSVQGELHIDEDENALRFYQVWHILPEGDAYWVHNDIFRLAISM